MMCVLCVPLVVSTVHCVCCVLCMLYVMVCCVWHTVCSVDCFVADISGAYLFFATNNQIGICFTCFLSKV